MTLQDVIDAETRRNKLTPSEIYLDGVDLAHGLMHHEWCFVRRVGMVTEKLTAVVMLCEFSPNTIHVIDLKLLCRFDRLHEQDLEFVDWIGD